MFWEECKGKGVKGRGQKRKGQKVKRVKGHEGERLRR